MRRYDLQVHTDASPCSNASPEDIAQAATEAGLDGIVVTDHDTMANVEAVHAAAAESVEVIPGVEVTTTQGHLLAVDVEMPPPQTDPVTVTEDIHEQGGYAVLSHPFDSLRQYYDEQLASIAHVVDAVEVINSRCLRPAFNSRAAEFAEANGLPGTGGSDAHFPMEVGRAYTETEAPLTDALESGEVRAAGRGGYLSGHVATKFTQFRRRFV